MSYLSDFPLSDIMAATEIVKAKERERDLEREHREAAADKSSTSSTPATSAFKKPVPFKPSSESGDNKNNDKTVKNNKNNASKSSSSSSTTSPSSTTLIIKNTDPHDKSRDWSHDVAASTSDQSPTRRTPGLIGEKIRRDENVPPSATTELRRGSDTTGYSSATFPRSQPLPPIK